MRSFIELYKISLLITPSTANMGRVFSVLTVPLIKLQNALAPNSLNKWTQLISIGTCMDDLQWGLMTN